MKIALAQLDYTIGDFENNVSKIKSAIYKARDGGADLVVFSELALTGYPPKDYLEYGDFLEKCQKAIGEIASLSKNIGVILGTPTINPEFEGKDLYNSACLLYEGEVKAVRHKSLLPNYGVFDEYRYFEPNKKWEIITFKNYKIALTICEDLWNVGNEPMYTVNPMDKLAEKKPDFIINIAASPFNHDQHGIRTAIMAENARKYRLPLVFVNQVGGQTDLLFDGGSMIFNPEGEIVHKLSFFQEDFRIVNIDNLPSGSPNLQYEKYPPEFIRAGLIYDALIMGIRAFFYKQGFSKAVLGLSGGIDSAVTLILAIEALGKDNVLSVLLPSPYTSDQSVTDALNLLKNTGSPYQIVNITDVYQQFRSTLTPVFNHAPEGLTDENLQARIRGIYLMAFCNNYGYILLNTSNKSEMAVGYGTLYGDLNGGLSVLGDVYKTDVYRLARYINREKEIIPENIFLKPPSAELKPNQKDSDSIPAYEILDQILYQHIENRRSASELFAMGFNKELVERVLRLVSSSEFKRNQAPPILRVTPKAFGIDRRMPIVAKYDV